jgi:hypothetical protein
VGEVRETGAAAGLFQPDRPGSDPGPGKGAGRLAAAGVLTADSASGRNLEQRKNESKKSAREGKADEAWSRMGMRTLKKTVERDLKCLAASTGRVRDFFFRTPCKSLDRILLAVGDSTGNSAVISLVWAPRPRRRSLHRPPLPIRRDGTTIVIAETERAAGHVDAQVLDALAEVAVWLPRP